MSQISFDADDLPGWEWQEEFERQQFEETAVPKTSEMIVSKFLRKEDFEEDRVMTIKGVKHEEMPGDSGDEKWVLYFKEDAKGMVLNITTIRLLEAGFGDDTDHWIGNRVKVYNDPNVTMAGRVVGGLRLRLPKKVASAPAAPPPVSLPEAPVADPEFDDDIPF